MSIVKEGIPFILLPIIFGSVLIYLGRYWVYPGFIVLLLGIFCIYFFRDPSRNVPDAGNVILSPGDGRVMEVKEEDGKKVIRIFLSVFNVHLQRAPVSGKVTGVEYRRGKFLPAMMSNAHKINEQNVITIKHPKGDFVVKQIAGILARRVVSWVKPQDEISAGEKIGLIRFGSQVDLYVPNTAVVKVKAGDDVVAGETIIGEIYKPDIRPETKDQRPKY